MVGAALGAACPRCADGVVEHDAALGAAVCTGCGAVLEENAVVSEVTFAELGTGATVLEGHFISGERGKAALPSVFGRRLGDVRRREALPAAQDAEAETPAPEAPPTESREATLANGRRRLQMIAAAVGIVADGPTVEVAFRWYSLALTNQFTRGRRSDNVFAACLYMACRMETPPVAVLLIDFADLLRASVYSLGGTYLRLARLLKQHQPLVDPSFYIRRFVAQLGFGERAAAVTATAEHVAKQMSRDWIVVGRRPTGVCAAAILIAARLHGFRRTQDEVVRVVRICEATLRRRLEEFARSPAAALTPDEFHNVVLAATADPPAFVSAARARRRQAPAPPAAAYAYTWAPPAADAPLEDLDDDPELRAMLLGADEVAVKTALWTELNRDYLDAAAERDRRRAIDESVRTAEAVADAIAAGEDDAEPLTGDTMSPAETAAPPRTRRRRAVSAPKPPARRTRTLPEAASAADAARSVLAGKRMSRKINYERLGDLFANTP